MNTDKDFFSEALDPANEDNWVPILQAKNRDTRADIYSITIPDLSTQILTATATAITADEDDVWGYVELAPNASEYPILRVPVRYVDQYCPAPTLPTETFAEIYDVKVNDEDSKGVFSFAHMTLDSDGNWVGVASEDGLAYIFEPDYILSFSLTRTQP